MNQRYLGIDIGASKIKGMLLERGTGSPKILASFWKKTPDTYEGFAEVLEHEISHILAGVKNVRSIGVGLPGPVHKKLGVLLVAPNIPYLKNWEAKKFFSQFGKSVEIENDVNCFLLAESRYGAGKGLKRVIGLTLGTGIGGAIMMDGEIYHGANYSAGEFGHMVIDHNSTLEKLGTEQVRSTRHARDKAIATGLANIVNALDPDIVILGGGVVTHRKVDLREIVRLMRHPILSPRAKRTRIVKAKLGTSAVAVGAALL